MHQSASLHDILDSSLTLKNENWNCTIIPYDGEENGTNTSLNVTIQNTPPENAVITINSSQGKNQSFEDLKCYSQLLDVDNDDMTVIVSWYNGDSQEVLEVYDNGGLNYPNGTQFEATLNFENTTIDDAWKCGIEVCDIELNCSKIFFNKIFHCEHIYRFKMKFSLEFSN